MFNFNPLYKISFFGVHGSGKTTLEIACSKKYDLYIPPKKDLAPYRMVNYQGLSMYLKSYHSQVKEINFIKKNIVTSRMGLIDVLIYSEALHKIERINNVDKYKIINQCNSLIDTYPLPMLLINITANTNVLYERLIERDQLYKNSFARDINKIAAIRQEYIDALYGENYKNELINELLGHYRSLNCLQSLDSSSKSPIELMRQISI